MRRDKPRWPGPGSYVNARERTNGYRKGVPIQLYKLGRPDGTPSGPNQPNRVKTFFSQNEKSTGPADVHTQCQEENNAHRPLTQPGKPWSAYSRFSLSNVPSSSSTTSSDPSSSTSQLATTNSSVKVTEVPNRNEVKQLGPEPFERSSKCESSESSDMVQPSISGVKRDQTTETELDKIEISGILQEVTALRDIVKQQCAKHSAREKELKDKISMLEEINQKLMKENFNLAATVKRLSSKQEVECIILD